MYNMVFPHEENHTSSGTVTIPSGAKYCTAYVYGADGTTVTTFEGSYPGGSGGCVAGSFYISSGNTLSVVVGAGGGAGGDGYNNLPAGGAGGGYSAVALNGTKILIAGGGGGAAAKAGGAGAGAFTAATVVTPTTLNIVDGGRAFYQDPGSEGSRTVGSSLQGGRGAEVEAAKAGGGGGGGGGYIGGNGGGIGTYQKAAHGGGGSSYLDKSLIYFMPAIAQISSSGYVRLIFDDAAPPDPPTPTVVNGSIANSAIITWPAASDTSIFYNVTSVPSVPVGAKFTFTTPTTVNYTGLSIGSTYTFTITAVTPGGFSPGVCNPITIVAIPNTPVITSVTPILEGITVSFSAPPDNGAIITSYTATASPGGKTGTSTSAGTINITGLTMQDYTVTVVANTSTQSSGQSLPSSRVSPLILAPTNVIASYKDNTAVVSWIESNRGGTNFTVTASPSSPNGSFTFTDAASGVFSGLTTGVTYTFNVVATTQSGSSPAAVSNPITMYDTALLLSGGQSYDIATPVYISGLMASRPYVFSVRAPTLPSLAASASITLMTPDAPLVSAVYIPGQRVATVSWQYSSTTLAASITDVTVTVNGVTDSNFVLDPSKTSGVYNNMIFGSSYHFEVAATNSSGTGRSGRSSTILAYTTPAPPTAVTARIQGNEAIINFVRPEGPILGYTAISSPGGFTGSCFSTDNSISVRGMNLLTSYTFTVRATNAVGTSISDPSLPIVLLGIPSTPIVASFHVGDGGLTLKYSNRAEEQPYINYTIVLKRKMHNSDQILTLVNINTTSLTTVIPITALGDYSITLTATNTSGSTSYVRDFIFTPTTFNTIGQYEFAESTAITSITIPAGVSIGRLAFTSTNLNYLIISDKVVKNPVSKCMILKGNLGTSDNNALANMGIKAYVFGSNVNDETINIIKHSMYYSERVYILWLCNKTSIIDMNDLKNYYDPNMATYSWQTGFISLKDVTTHIVDWNMYASMTTADQQAYALANYPNAFFDVPSAPVQAMISTAASVNPTSAPLVAPTSTQITNVLFAAATNPACYDLLPVATNSTGAPVIKTLDATDATAFIAAVQSIPGRTSGELTLPLAVARPQISNGIYTLPSPPTSSNGTYFVAVDTSIDRTYKYTDSADTLVVAGGVRTFLSATLGPTVLGLGTKYTFTYSNKTKRIITVNYLGSEGSTLESADIENVDPGTFDWVEYASAASLNEQAVTLLGNTAPYSNLPSATVQKFITDAYDVSYNSISPLTDAQTLAVLYAASIDPSYYNLLTGLSSKTIEDPTALATAFGITMISPLYIVRPFGDTILSPLLHGTYCTAIDYTTDKDYTYSESSTTLSIADSVQKVNSTELTSNVTYTINLTNGIPISLSWLAPNFYGVNALDLTVVQAGSIQWSSFVLTTSPAQQTAALNGTLTPFVGIDWNKYAAIVTDPTTQNTTLQDSLDPFVGIDWDRYIEVVTDAAEQKTALEDSLHHFDNIEWSVYAGIVTESAKQQAALKDNFTSFINISWSAFVTATTKGVQTSALEKSLSRFVSVDWPTYVSVSTVEDQATALSEFSGVFSNAPAAGVATLIQKAAAVKEILTSSSPPGDITAVLYAASLIPGYYSLLPTATDSGGKAALQALGMEDASTFITALTATGKTQNLVAGPISLAVPVNNVLPAPPAAGLYFATVNTGLDATYSYVGSDDTLIVTNGVERFQSSIAGAQPVVLALGAQYVFTPTGGQSMTLTVNYAGGDLSSINQPAPCFLYDAPVLTPAGYKAIGELCVGDLVVSSAGPMAIKTIKKELAAPNDESYPCVVPEGLYGATQRLLISPHHQILVAPGVYKEARFLRLDREVIQVPWDYYNLELDDNTADMIVAGVVVETWKEWDGVERFA